MKSTEQAVCRGYREGAGFVNARVVHKTVGLIIGLALSASTAAASGPFDLERPPILVLGASLENGSPPINDSLLAPFNGGAVNGGSYLSLGDALVVLGMFVINEAQSGATSFDRDFCLPDSCASFGWQGYSTQLQKALKRVGGANAKYVWIGLGNDCLHSLASGAPWGASPFGACGIVEIDAFVDRAISAAQAAQSAGLTPVFPLFPAYSDLDLPSLQQQTGLPYVADEGQFNLIAEIWKQRLMAEVPDAVIVDAWADFEHLGDGLHPTPKTSLQAARRVVQAIHRHEQHPH